MGADQSGIETPAISARRFFSTLRTAWVDAVEANRPGKIAAGSSPTQGADRIPFRANCPLPDTPERAETAQPRVLAAVVMRLTLPGRDLEHAVLAALWDHGPSLARDVHRLVGEPRGLAYTTINTVLDRLHTKALVDRHKQGRTFVYRARVQRETITKALAREAVASILWDKPRPAMAALIDAVEAVDPDLIDELEQLVAERRRGNKGGSRRGS